MSRRWTEPAIVYLTSKGAVVENVEEINTQTLCSYRYAAYKREYEDDWRERLELYNDLDLASGEPMDYRTRTKAWNKFIDKLKRLVSPSTFHHNTILM